MPLTAILLSTLLAAPQEPVAMPEVHKGTLLVEAATIHVGPDRVLRDSAILVRDGKVLYVGDEIPADAKQGATRLTLSGATLVPGFVNAHSSLGHGGQLAERIDAFTPELTASDAFDPFAEPVLESARAGVTAAVLAPSSFNAFAGQAAVVHTGRIGSVLVESGFLKLAMVDQAFDQNRFPTSRMGAADLIRRTFKEARAASGPRDARLKVLAEVVHGGRRAAFHVATKAEIGAVLDLCEELSIKPLLLGCDEGHEWAERIAKLAAGVVLAPLQFDSPPQRLAFPAELERLGVPFSFLAEHPEHLRISAALALRHGATPKAALAALTSTAAQHAGAEALVGSLFEGRSADFCAFDGDPLDLTSRLLAVHIAGLPVEKANAR